MNTTLQNEDDDWGTPAIPRITDPKELAFVAHWEWITDHPEDDHSPPGFIYMAQDRGSQLVKMGWTQNPEQRISTLKRGCPRLVLLCYWSATRFQEKALHYQYKYYRRVGEWFQLPRYIIAAMRDNWMVEYNHEG